MLRFDDHDGSDNAAIAFFLARTAEHLLLKEDVRKEVRREEEEAKREKEEVELLSLRATLYHFDRCEAGPAQDHRQSSL